MKDNETPAQDERTADPRDARSPDGTPAVDGADATTSAGFPRVAATGAESADSSAETVPEPEVVGGSAPGVGHVTHGSNLAAAVGATTGPSDPPPSETAPAADASKLDQARHKLYDAARQVRDRVETQASHLSDEVQRGARRASHAIHDSTEAAYERTSAKVEAGYRKASAQLEHGYEQLSHTVDERSGQLDRFVRDNPGRAVLTVAGAGFLLGLLLRGKR